MFHLLCHQGLMGIVCLQQDSDHVCLWPGYHLHHNVAKHGYSGVVKELTGEWNGALSSLVMKVHSVCVQVVDIHVYDRHLVSVIFQSTFAHDTEAPP